jgi:DNA-binding CsgD family transcriptional regulator
VTPAEARLGVGLADGLSMAEIAERHDVKVQTLRSQLKSLFWKVGVRRQAELVRQLAALQCMAPHGHPPA